MIFTHSMRPVLETLCSPDKVEVLELTSPVLYVQTRPGALFIQPLHTCFMDWNWNNWLKNCPWPKAPLNKWILYWLESDFSHYFLTLLNACAWIEIETQVTEGVNIVFTPTTTQPKYTHTFHRVILMSNHDMFCDAFK